MLLGRKLGRRTYGWVKMWSFRVVMVKFNILSFYKMAVILLFYPVEVDSWEKMQIK
jgi:hypothetical protein